MTNRDAVIAEVGVPIDSDDAVDKAIIDLDIDGTETYKGHNTEDIAEAAIKVLKTLLSIKSLREGGLDVTLQIEARIAAIQQEHGWTPVVEVVKPKIRAYHGW